jgi:hypothetical protein
VFANLLYNENGTEVVGFDSGLCTLTPAINNTGDFKEMCTIVLFFNGTDQVVLVSALSAAPVSPMAVVGGVGAFDGASGSCITSIPDNIPNSFFYDCEFWTPNFRN